MNLGIANYRDYADFKEKTGLSSIEAVEYLLAECKKRGVM